MPRPDHDPDDLPEVPPGRDDEETPRPPRRPRRPRRRDFEQPDEPIATLIPYKNPKALAAYYCGVFGLIPCVGLILGPVALILGILGVRYVNANPTAKGTGHAIAGIVLGALELLFNWGALIFMLVAVILGARK